MAKSKGKRARANESTNVSKSTLSKKRKLAASNSKAYQDGSMFVKTVESAGLTLMGEDAPNVLNVDQVIFQRNMQKALKKNVSVTETVKEFLDGLQNYIEEEPRFKHSLLRTVSSPDCESARSGQQDSLIRLLLNIEEIQPPLISLLLEKLAEFLDEDNESVFDHQDGSSLPKMILSQFYWLDRIVNVKEMTAKMLEIVEVCSLAVQKDIIGCIPEVITDDEHNNVAIKLKELMEQNSELIVSILNSLSNLNVMPELLKEVCKSAMQTLNSANLEDLPVIVKFILRTVTPSTALEVIQELRRNLDFTSSQACLNENQKKSAEDSELILLETIRLNVLFNKTIATAWMKAIEVVTADDSQLGLQDLFVMLMFHGMAAHKKAVEGLFRKKIRDYTLSQELVEKSFEAHPKVMMNYFTSVLYISCLLVRSLEPLLSVFATALYREAFLTFDVHHKQAIIGALVTHIGGSNRERDASLDLLLELVNTAAKEMATFAIFLKKNLDDLHKLSLPQVRKLFVILSGLTFGDDGQEATIQDELHNFVRKQLTCSDLSYKRIGVIAALAIFKKMSSKRSDGGPCSDAKFKQIMILLKLVRSSCKDWPQVVGLFCDEMSDIVGKTKLDDRVQGEIAENVLNDFQEDYVVDIATDELTDESGLSMVTAYSLETEESQNDIAMNLLPLISQAAKKPQCTSKKSRGVYPMCMAPQFRLLQVCIKAQSGGNLEDIDALLGCPIYTFRAEIADKMDSLSTEEKELACSCIVSTLNWFREIINAFAATSLAELKAKVIGRVQGITELETMLEKCLAVTPGFNPPIATFDAEASSDIKAAGPSTSGRNKAGAKKKRKKPSQDKENMPAADESGVSSSQIDETEDDEKSALTLAEVRVNVSDYKAFFRELDLDVFHILSCGLLTKHIMDTDHHTKEVQHLQLEPSQLEFLLGDLLDKTKHALTTKKATYLQVKGKSKLGFSRLNQLSAYQVAKKLVKFLPSLAHHLEATNTYIQALTTQNDGLVDGPGSTSTNALKMKSCFQLILEILLTFFSWDGLLTKDSSSLLEEALTVFAVKDVGQSGGSKTVKHLSKKCCLYFQEFASSVPNLESGVVLLSLLQALTNIQRVQRNEAIGKLSETFLKREWLDQDGERCKGAKHNESLQKVIRSHLCHSGEDTLQAIEAICSTGVPELMNAGTNGCSTTYPTLTQSTFSSFYRIMFEELVIYQKAVPAFSSRDPMETQSQKLADWNVSVRVMYMLISLIKAFEARTNVTTALKHGKASIEVFMRNGMPAMDLMFKSQRADVQSLLKNLQQSTRLLQYMCNHTKVAQDIALTNHVPALKRILEQFVYRVKAMLTLHNCHEAFWLGNLKNKDLKGDEISSQVCRADEESESEEEEDGDNREKNDEGSEDEDDDESEKTADEEGNDDGVSCSEDY